MTHPDDESALIASSLAVPVNRPSASAPGLLRPLNDRMLAFIDYYCGEAKFNAMEAARLAGYSDPRQSGYQCKVHPGVREEINARLSAFNLSQMEVLKELADLALAPTDHFMQIQKPSFTDPETGERYPAILRLDYSSKVRALEILARAHGLLADGQRQEVSVKVVVGIDLDKL